MNFLTKALRNRFKKARVKRARRRSFLPSGQRGHLESLESRRLLATCLTPSVDAGGYCWAVATTEANENPATHGQNIGMVPVAGFPWTQALMADVATALGANNLGDTGCCSGSAWYDAQSNGIYTHGFHTWFNFFDDFNGDRPIHAFFKDSDADLSISKEAEDGPFVAGDEITYTLTVSNAGPDDAFGVVATDSLPSGLNFVETDGCENDPDGSPSCSLGNIAAGGSKSFTLTANVAASAQGNITNNASVTSETPDPDSNNNSTSETVAIDASSDLSITITDDTTNAIAGQDEITYTVTVNNAGPSDATNVQVTESLPSGVTLVSTNGCTPEDPNGVPTCSLGTITANSSKQFTITVAVDAGTVGTITNVASVSSDVMDGNASNNTASEDTLVSSTADLSVTKSDDADPVFSGRSQITYTVTVHNAGPSDAVNVYVTDNLPTGVTFVSTNGCDEDPNGIPGCTLGTLPANSSASYTIMVDVDDETIGLITNAATVGSDTNDNNSSNNTASEGTLVVAATDLSISKIANTSSVVAGLDQITYTVIVHNAGPSEATNVQVTDNLPPGTSLVSTSGCTPEDPNGAPTCSLGSLPLNASASYTMTVNVDSDAVGSITNTATVTSDVADYDPSNNSASAQTQVNSLADLSITKTDAADPVTAGLDQILYTVTVHNAGPSDAPDVVVIDNLPPGVLLASTSGCTPEDPNGVPTCSLGTIPANGSASYTIIVDIDPDTLGSITNAVSVSSGATDINPTNNTATESTIVEASANLSITKSDDADVVVAGQDQITYTVTVHNAGPSAATNVRVMESLPAGVTFDSTSGCAHEDPIGVPTCSLETIAAGDSASFTVTVDVNSDVTGSITNTATVTSDVADSNLSNNTATESTIVTSAADLSVTKSDDSDTVVAGLDQITYTVTVHNAGPSDATNVRVTESLPAGVTFVSTNGCTPEDPNGVPMCSLGTIAANSSASYSITVDVNSGTQGSVTNTATVSADATDNNLSNNTATEQTQVDAVADLSITKTDAADPVTAGQDQIVYSITIHNAGPSDATNVVVNDNLPPGLALISTIGCSPEDPNGVPTCSLGTIAANSSASFTIVADVPSDTIGNVSNTATVSSSASDSNPANNSATESTLIEAEANLSITKNGNVNTVIAGQDQITYTMTVYNAGPSDAPNVQVTDTLPSDVTLASTSGCTTEDPNGVPTCSLGTIAANSSASYTITVDVDSDAQGSITNSATVSSDAPDNFQVNNTASEITLVGTMADLSITKTDNVDPVAAGREPIIYTVTVHNAGPSDAKNVRVNDTLPFGVTFVSTSGCTVQDPNGVPTCSLGTIPANGSATYTVAVDVDLNTLGLITNHVAVVADTPLTNTGNDTATEDTLIVYGVDLSVTKTADFDALSGTLTYLITVSNAGPSDAENVVATDTLPVGLSANSTSGCAEDPIGVPDCSLGTIEAGGFAQYTIDVALNSSSTDAITNHVSVTNDIIEIAPNNNSTTVITTVKVTDPGVPFVDANNDGHYWAADGDVALESGELADGKFSTKKKEGSYKNPISGAGLVIPPSADILDGVIDGTLRLDTFNFAVDGSIIVGVDLTAVKKGIKLATRTGSIELDGRVDASASAKFKSGADVILSNSAVVNAKQVDIHANGSIDITGADVSGLSKLKLVAEGDIWAGDATVRVLDTTKGKIELEAGGMLEMNGAQVFGRKSVDIDIVGDIFAQQATIVAANTKGAVKLKSATGNINLAQSSVLASKQIKIESFGKTPVTGDVRLNNALVAMLQGSTKGKIKIKAIDQIFKEGLDLLAPGKRDLIADSFVGTEDVNAAGPLPNGP